MTLWFHYILIWICYWVSQRNLLLHYMFLALPNWELLKSCGPCPPSQFFIMITLCLAYTIVLKHSLPPYWSSSVLHICLWNSLLNISCCIKDLPSMGPTFGFFHCCLHWPQPWHVSVLWVPQVLPGLWLQWYLSAWLPLCLACLSALKLLLCALVLWVYLDETIFLL